MSTASMTGFGRGEAFADGVSVVVELGSVNRKQFESHVSVQRELAPLEAQIQALLQKYIRRGQIKGMVSASFSGAGCGVVVNEELAAAQLAAIRGATTRLGLRDDLSATSLFALPDVLVRNPSVKDVQKLWPVVSEAVEKAVRGLVSMREREGKALAKNVGERLAVLRGLRAELEKRAAVSPKEYRDKLAQRLQKLADGVAVDDAVLARELIVFADRTDVSEELTRIASHLDQAEALMKGNEPAGRSLDFLCQELLREINTTGSKCSDGPMSKLVIEFKSVLETIREQVQNFE